MSVNLVAFLLARIAEDEQRAIRADRDRIRSAVYRSPNCYSADLLFIDRFDSARMLAECAAKQALIRDVLDYEAAIDGEWGCCHSADNVADGLCPEHPVDEITALRLLALLYADHDDYRAEWRPQ